MSSAVVHLRISQDRTGQQAVTRRQQEDCLALAARLGVTEHPQRPLTHLQRTLPVHRVPSLLEERNESQADSNLRPRHALAALGFVFALRSNAFDEAPKVADRIVDLLAKLGREDDAYDAVALIVPQHDHSTNEVAENVEDEELNEELIEIELEAAPEFEPTTLHKSESDSLFDQLLRYPAVGLATDQVPFELSPARFFAEMISHVLDNSPITRHEQARTLIKRARTDARGQ